jgi:hypothetical protein
MFALLLFFVALAQSAPTSKLQRVSVPSIFLSTEEKNLLRIKVRLDDMRDLLGYYQRHSSNDELQKSAVRSMEEQVFELFRAVAVLDDRVDKPIKVALEEKEELLRFLNASESVEGMEGEKDATLVKFNKTTEGRICVDSIVFKSPTTTTTLRGIYFSEFLFSFLLNLIFCSQDRI